MVLKLDLLSHEKERPKTTDDKTGDKYHINLTFVLSTITNWI